MAVIMPKPVFGSACHLTRSPVTSNSRLVRVWQRQTLLSSIGFQNRSGSPSATCGFLGDVQAQRGLVLQVDGHNVVQRVRLDPVKYRSLLGEFYAVFNTTLLLFS